MLEGMENGWQVYNLSSIGVISNVHQFSRHTSETWEVESPSTRQFDHRIDTTFLKISRYRSDGPRKPLLHEATQWLTAQPVRLEIFKSISPIELCYIILRRRLETA